MESISISRCNRVVGKPEKDCKIYIEDYVKSYMARLSQDASDKGNIEILYGKYRTDGRRMEIDVNGAAALTNIARTGRQTETLVKQIEMLNQKFFPELEPVGWFYNKEKTRRTDYAFLMDIHEELLGQRNGILVLPSSDSEDPDVFSYAEDGFRKHKGYVVYYEKNTEMQEYLLANTGKSEEGAKLRDVAGPLREKINGENFKQRIISLPLKVKKMSREIMNREINDKEVIKEEKGGKNNAESKTEKKEKGVPLSVSFIITGLLVIVFAGMLTAFKTYYYTNLGDTMEYVKEFIRYCMGEGG